jgi:hypothetical protein
MPHLQEQFTMENKIPMNLSISMAVTSIYFHIWDLGVTGLFLSLTSIAVAFIYHTGNNSICYERFKETVPVFCSQDLGRPADTHQD